MSNWKPKAPERVSVGSALKITGLLIAAVIQGCFGPPAMHYDIAAYNRDAETAEAEMLLYNIGQLSDERPPHFMMLQEVDQTRTFSAGGSFQWTHLTDSLYDSRLSPSEVNILNHNVTALIQHDRDDLVRDFLAAMKEADGVLTGNVAQKLAGYP